MVQSKVFNPIACALACIVSVVGFSGCMNHASFTHLEGPAASPSCSPEILHVVYGGNGRSYELVYDRRKLAYYVANHITELKQVEPVIIVPTPQAWERLYYAVKRVGERGRWQYYYADDFVRDGTYWSFVINYSSLPPCYLHSSGSNAYPEDFNEVFDALRELLKEVEFER